MVGAKGRYQSQIKVKDTIFVENEDNELKHVVKVSVCCGKEVWCGVDLIDEGIMED